MFSARTAALGAILLLLSAASEPARSDSEACTSLATDTVVTQVVAAGTSVPGGADAAALRLPGYCRATGVLQPVAGSRIGFELWLPERARWTGRFQMLGNGGYSSALPLAQMAAALARGSAVVATDTGHHGDDPDFARGHREAIVDWGWRAVHLSAVSAKALTARYYGHAARHSYFNGCSTGGHQAMMEAQRFPADFDGIVAGAPGADRVRLNAAFLWQYLSNHPRGDDRAAILDQNDLSLLHDAVLARCSTANGARDGGLDAGRWLDDPLACRPRPEALTCRAGGPQACLTPAKVRTAKAMYAGVVNAHGARLTFPWLPGSEPGWSAYWADPRQPTQPARVNFWRDWAFADPKWDWWTFDYGRDLPRAMAHLSPIIDATDPDLRPFRARGGRLLQYHGLADPVVSPLDTLAYRGAMLATTGSGDAQSWYRLFLVPGMGHCGGGPGLTDFDAQGAVERWVEQNVQPDTLVARGVGGTTRPLCPYPARAVYHRRDPTSAASFTCTKSRGHTS